MNQANITINNQLIGQSHPPYIIAELSANHNGRIENALAIIQAAKDAGASAVKLQTYHPDTITLNSNKPEFCIKGGLWDGKTLYELYQSAYMPWEWHEILFAKAREIGITIFSSPFDKTAVDLLENLNAPAYKIASFELVDIPLIQYVAQTGKPMIMSTGMADEAEITEAISAARDAGCKDLAILHCVSGYPAPADEYNLRTITDMIEQFGLVTGLSDHTLDNTTAITSIALGASIVEKHITLDRSGGGADDSFSLEPKELAHLCQATRTAWSALGKVNYERTESEKGNVQFRRSLYAVKAIKKGEVFTEENIRSVRPGFGLSPKMLPKVLGKTAVCDIEANEPIKTEFIGR